MEDYILHKVVITTEAKFDYASIFNLLEVIDEESFLPWSGSGRIEIVMSKSYAIGIKKLAEILLEKQVDLRRTEANGQGL